MKTLVKALPHSTRRSSVNTTGSTIPSGTLVDLGDVWGVAVNDVADTQAGEFETRGWVRVVKTTGFTAARGQGIGWDAATSKAVLLSLGKPLGVAVKPAATADLVMIVDLNADPEVYRAQVVGDAVAGLEIDLGFGAVPTGPVMVISRTTAGVERVVTSVVLETAGDAGKITITTTAGAASDVHHVIAYRE